MALDIHKTSLNYLGLVSLQEVKRGSVAIYRNPKLCHVDSFNWTAAGIIAPGPVKKFLIGVNGNSTVCSE